MQKSIVDPTISLASAIELVEKNWQFDEHAYPALKLKGVDEFAFKVSHIQRHMTKGVGAMANLLERVDHGQASLGKSISSLEEIALKQIVNGMRLLAVVRELRDPFCQYGSAMMLQEHILKAQKPEKKK